MASSTVLLGDYFVGEQLAKWLALQTGSANIVAVAMNLLSGALGEHSWRTPFLAYGISLLQIPLVALLIWTPRRVPGATVVQSARKAGKREGGDFRLSRLMGLCLITIFQSTAFYLVVVQLGFLLAERGVHSPALIGRGVALSVLSLPLGAYLSRLLRIPYIAKMALSLTLSALGFLVLALARTYATSVLGGVITDLGSGIALTTLITWALSSVPGLLRGRATGAWQASFAFGQFASPLVVVGLMRLVGARSHAVMVYAVLCGICSVLAALMLTLRGTAPAGAQVDMRS